MPSDFGDESGEKLFDWMLRIGQDASEAALIDKCGAPQGRVQERTWRGESRCRRHRRGRRASTEWAKLRMAEFEALPEYETIKEAIDSKLAEQKDRA